MAKYICDFNQVTTIADQLISAASDLTNATTKYVSQVESELANWTGVSKDFFSQQTRSQAKYSIIKANSYNCIGEYLKGFAQKVDNLEQSLSNNKI